MASKTQILQLAAQKLSTALLTSITDDSPQARAMALCYDPMLGIALRRHVWNFATMRKNIQAQATPTPEYGFSFYLPLPGDFVRLDEAGTKCKYKIENDGANHKCIAFNAQTLNIRYVRLETNAQLFDPLFYNYFSTEIALQVARSLTDAETAVQRLFVMRKEDLDEARLVDSIEEPPDELEDGEWVDARN